MSCQEILLFFFFLDRPVFSYPALLIFLAGACNGESAGRYILGYDRSCGGIYVVPYGDRRNQRCLATKEYVIAHLAAVLFKTIIIYEHRTAAHVHVAAHVGIAHVGKVCHGSLFAYG